MRRPTLFLTVGLPGTGKTTVAREIVRARPALRLTKDEWVKALFGADNPPSASDVIEAEWAATIQVPTPGELDGTEPIDPPPTGFATWDEWRTGRWLATSNAPSARPRRRTRPSAGS